MRINPSDYWKQRHHAHAGLRGVGNIGFSEGYNRWLYRAKRSVFRREARRSVAHPRRASVLDIGSGRGFILEQWMRLGCRRIVGCDFAEPALKSLRRHFPNVQLINLDIGKQPVPYHEEFDAVSAVDVLYHLMDEASLSQAIKNAFQALRPGGVFIFTDMFLHGESAAKGHHTVHRPWCDIQRHLSDAGFEVERRRPLYVLMENPKRSKSPLLRLTWSIVARLARRGSVVGAGVGAVLLPIELLASRLVRKGPGLEVFICRKPA